MRQMQPVLWTKGVLLSPQHLQTQDRFLEDLLEFNLSALSFRPWGFQRLEIDREALSGGTLTVSSAAGIFPDGLLFDFPGPDAAPPPRPLEGVWEPDQHSIDVYLAVPEYRPGGYNVASAQRDPNTRYQAEVLMRRDETNGLAEKPIQVARKNVRLLVEGEAIEGYSTLKVARVRRSGTGETVLDGRFIPSVIDITASDHLMAIARRLVELLAAKSTALSGTRRQKHQSLADFSISDVANFWLLYTVNTYLPIFRHLYEVRRGHPSELFDAMLRLGGSLTTFSTNVHPRALPAYDHANLSDCMIELDEIVRTLLETVVPSNCVSLPLRLERPSVYAVALDQDRYLGAQQMYLAVNAEVNQAFLLERTPQVLKLSSADDVDRLVRMQLSGLTLAHTPNPPSAVPVKLNYQYFQLNRAGPEWEAIKRARNLAAFVPGELPNPQLELVIVLPPK
jgi:type VI secretion system protein ImpJ